MNHDLFYHTRILNLGDWILHSAASDRQVYVMKFTWNAYEMCKCQATRSEVELARHRWLLSTVIYKILNSRISHELLVF